MGLHRYLMSRVSILLVLAAIWRASIGVRGAFAWYIPPPGTSFYWQLSGSQPGLVDMTVNAQVYDIDGFATSAATIARLHAAGRKVVCYFSFGSAEDYRSDYSQFPRSTLGGLVCNSDDCSEVWEGERWLDVRSSVVRSVLEKRVQLAKRKGCDSIEPDNLDAWSNNIMYKTISRFKITAADQANFNFWIARTVHKYGMSVGLKNPGSLLPAQMGAAFDWALVEQCNQYSDWSQGLWYSGKYGCDYANEFVVRGKAVFIAEYTDSWGTTAGRKNGIQFPQAMCADNNAHGFTTRLYNMDLEPGYRYPFADCLRHKPAGCDGVWRQCIKPAVYQPFLQSGMKRWDAVGQCMRSKVAQCAYK